MSRSISNFKVVSQLGNSQFTFISYIYLIQLFLFNIQLAIDAHNINVVWLLDYVMLAI